MKTPTNEAVEKLARLLAKNEGGFMFSAEASLIENKHPEVKRWVATAVEILELLDKLSVENLNIADIYNKSKIVPAGIEKIEVVKIPTWEDINEWAEELYLCCGELRSGRMTFEQYELDRVAALEDRFTHAQLQLIHHDLAQIVDNYVFAPQRDKTKLAKAVVEMLNPYPKALEINLYFKFDAKTHKCVCVGGEAADHWASNHKGDYSVTERIILPVGLNPLGSTISELRERAKTFTNPMLGSNTEAVETASNNETDKSKGQLALGYSNGLIEPLKETKGNLPKTSRKLKVVQSATAETQETAKPAKTFKVELFFDSNDVCLGGQALRPGFMDYTGLYAYSLNVQLAEDVKPVGKKIDYFPNTKWVATYGDKSPKHIGFGKLTRAEKDLMESFRGRENEFERFRVIKKELAAINIKVGNKIDTTSDIKAWFVTGGDKGKDKAALYFTSWDGWEIGCREGQDNLTGVFEDWSLIQHLDDNDVEVNGIAAGDWHNARDEDAEAEAIELQEEEKKAERQPSPDIKWINIPR